MQPYQSLTMASASLSTISLIGILQTASSSTIVLAHPLLPQHPPEQISPDISQLTEYLFMPAEDSELLGPENTISNFIPSPKFDLLPPAAPIEMIPDITLSTLSDSSYTESTAFVNGPVFTVTSTTEASSDPSSSTAYSSNATPTSTQTTTSTTVSTSQDASPPPPLGPGLVLHSTTSALSDSRTSMAAFVPSNTPKPDPFITDGSSAAAPEASRRTTVVVGSVVSGLFAFSMITCVLLNMRRLRGILFARGAHPDTDPQILKDSEKAGGFLPENNAKENSSEPSVQLASPVLPVWMKLPSQISPFYNHRDSLLSYFRLARDSASSQPSKQQQRKTQKTRILDIVSDFPRSRFSVTSSDYTHSIRSIDSNHHLDHAVVSPRRSVPLLTPEEFFSLPSSTTLISRHSRTGSAPVFGRHWGEGGLNSALSTMQSLEEEERPDTNPNAAKSRPLSMTVMEKPYLQRRRTRSIAVVENGVCS
ncbi:hypothetical protein GGU10DRAFT_51993 [Lentinula aff. detonsa]|uniref:Uncharacterized protein n=1 Tax=Lentinula aff. detonsa TaxID=2804958 RepID=A0AA38NL13_9AGAR|nr:hypothetical protein GGU10DRAFT_51993 [Lentinula aff. detonsa]